MPRQPRTHRILPASPACRAGTVRKVPPGGTLRTVPARQAGLAGSIRCVRGCRGIHAARGTNGRRSVRHAQPASGSRCEEKIMSTAQGNGVFLDALFSRLQQAVARCLLGDPAYYLLRTRLLATKAPDEPHPTLMRTLAAPLRRAGRLRLVVLRSLSLPARHSAP